MFLPGESRDRGAWWAAVYGAAQSRTRLKRLSSSSSNNFHFTSLPAEIPGKPHNGAGTVPRVNPKVNCGLQVIIMSTKVHPGENYTMLVSDINKGGGYAHVGTEGIQEISAPFSKGCYKLKTALKQNL